MRRLWPLLPAVALLGWCILAGWRALSPSGARMAREPVDWTREPAQTTTDRPAFTIATRQGPVTLRPRAAYEISGVAAGAERYWRDADAFLSPVDVALVWGKLPEEPYWRGVRYTQGDRYYLWRTSSPELDPDYIAEHSANLHAIPAKAAVRRALLAVGAGDWVRLRGLLVDAAGPGGFTWKTSLSRNDTGPASCELLWVEEAQIGDRVYR